MSFQLLAIINKAAVNIVEHLSLLHAGESSGDIPRSGITGSCKKLKTHIAPNTIIVSNFNTTLFN